MESEKKAPADLPTVEQIEAEHEGIKYGSRNGSVLKRTATVLTVVAIITILVATLWLPVFKIYGSSMSPTLTEGQIVVAVKSDDYKTGDLCALSYGNKLLVKRIIAGSGSWVDIDKEGNVYVDGEFLEEPYLTEKALGDGDLSYPYQIPESRWFVMGDNRALSVDSRNLQPGCLTDESIIGRIVFCVWPLSEFGRIN